MYSIIPCEKIQNNIFNLKKDLSLKNKYLDQYKLLNKGLYKIYYKNNYLIKSSEKNIKYFKIIEKDNYFEGNNLFFHFFVLKQKRFGKISKISAFFNKISSKKTDSFDYNFFF